MLASPLPTPWYPVLASHGRSPGEAYSCYRRLRLVRDSARAGCALAVMADSNRLTVVSKTYGLKKSSRLPIYPKPEG